jgi:hypothetical protein
LTLVSFIHSFIAVEMTGFNSYPPANLNLNTKGKDPQNCRLAKPKKLFDEEELKTWDIQVIF